MYGITCAVTLKEKTFDWNKIKQKTNKKNKNTKLNKNVWSLVFLLFYAFVIVVSKR